MFNFRDYIFFPGNSVWMFYIFYFLCSCFSLNIVRIAALVYLSANSITSVISGYFSPNWFFLLLDAENYEFHFAEC